MTLAERANAGVHGQRLLERLAFQISLHRRVGVHGFRSHAHALAHGVTALQLVRHHAREARQIAGVQLQQRGEQHLAQVVVHLKNQQDEVEVVDAELVHEVELVAQHDLAVHVGRHEQLHAAVAHGARDLAEHGVHHEEDPEVVVRTDHALLAVHQPALVHQQEAVVLEKAVQSVQHGGVAEVGVVEHYPVPAHDGFNQRPVDPLERHVIGRTLDRFDGGQDLT